MLEKNKPEQIVQSLDRALYILEKLVNSKEGLGVTELSNSLGIHKSTVYRLLATLNYRGYVKKDKSDKYKVGLKLFEIGSIVLNELDLRIQVRPFLEELMAKTNETIHLAIVDEKEVVYIDKVESSETIRMYSKIGRRVPVHCTSLGKIILAYYPLEIVKKIIKEKGLTRYTDNTIINSKEFIKHLKEIKNKGYAIDNQEQEEGIRCIAGPIFDYQNKVIAAFSISGPTIRISEKRVEQLVKIVKSYACKISQSFGWQAQR